MFLENGWERIISIVFVLELKCTRAPVITSEYRLRERDKAAVGWPTNSFEAHFDTF